MVVRNTQLCISPKTAIASNNLSTIRLLTLVPIKRVFEVTESNHHTQVRVNMQDMNG
jgi:hypothetical protein